MSKLFDALNKGGTEASETFLRALNENPAPLPESSPATAPPPKLRPEDLPPDIRELLDAPQQRPIPSPAAVDEQVFPLKLGLNSPLLPFDEQPNRASEEYRIIRTKIFQHAKRPRMIVVSSAGPLDGKSVTAINLAGVLSLKSDATVLLLDADFRRSSIASTLGLPSTAGLADVLTGKRALESVILRAEQLPNLYILPAGECASNPAELLDSPAWLETCAELRQRFDYIVLDSPPIQAVADYGLIQAASDGVVAVVRPDFTKRGALDAAFKSIPPEKLIGIVMNCVSDWFLTNREQHGYSYHYGRPEHS